MRVPSLKSEDFSRGFFGALLKNASSEAQSTDSPTLFRRSRRYHPAPTREMSTVLAAAKTRKPEGRYNHEQTSDHQTKSHHERHRPMLPIGHHEDVNVENTPPATKAAGRRSHPPSATRAAMGRNIMSAARNHHASGWCAASNPAIGRIIAPAATIRAKAAHRHPVRRASVPVP